MIGRRFGRLIVLEQVEERRCSCLCYKVRCDCGTEKIVKGADLRRNNTQSCGCLQIERTQKVNTGKIIHGGSRLTLYKVWTGIKQRCTNPKEKRFARYGGRGIKVCDEWLNSFETFWKWAIQSGYEKGLTIERKENDEGYNPDNCTWIPRAKQQCNTRRTIKFEGTSLRNYCITHGLDYNKVLGRVQRGMKVEEAILHGKPNSQGIV